MTIKAQSSFNLGAVMDFNEAVSKVLAFRDARDWQQFHNPKDLAISISLEASELLEAFQWSGADLEASHKRDLIKEELADVFIYCIDLADRLKLDVPEIIAEKILVNDKKYPVAKSKGNAKKHTEL